MDVNKAGPPYPSCVFFHMCSLLLPLCAFCLLGRHALLLLLFACRHGELVRVLGLGGVVTFDYSEDARKARLVGCDEDYVNFEGAYQQKNSTSNADLHLEHLIHAGED
jgi:hypothetical protein